MKKILKPIEKNGISLKNRIVMAPMTRTRAIGNKPNSLMAEYYAQRAGAGLIITEGVAPVPNGLGYPNISGIFNEEQIEGWQEITKRVHEKGSKIFIQLMHTGRMGHTSSLPPEAVLVGPSDIPAAGEIYTTEGMQAYSKPTALTKNGIQETVLGFAQAATNARIAGFDGVELHAANGYLIEQFLNPNVNNRKDEYGGSIENRSRFAIEVVEAVAKAIGPSRVGIRFSPFSSLGDLSPYDEAEVQETYSYLAKILNEKKIAYLHIGVNAETPESTFESIRNHFSGIIIQCNGLTPETAEEALQSGFADLVAFGRAFLANPDLVTRIAQGAKLNELDFATFYGTSEKGYTDYPTLTELAKKEDLPIRVKEMS